MKTNPLKILIFLFSIRAGAEGVNTFECLRDLLPLTERGSFQTQRHDVEKPFLLNGKYIVFPEVAGRKLTGFFMYDQKRAWYYDTVSAVVQGEKKVLPIAKLTAEQEMKLYQMVVQPSGLETVTIQYMPGLDPDDSSASGPVMLGTAVLPVIGAFVSRPNQYRGVYQNPSDVGEERLEAAVRKSSRGPASVEAKVERKIVTLSTSEKKSKERLWQPLRRELKLREDWIKSHNLDDQTFKDVARTLDGSCKAQKRATP